VIRQFLLEVKLWVLIYKMRSRNNKSKSNIQRKVIRFFLLIGVAILLITFFFGDHGLYHLYTIKAERKKIQGEIDFLREKRVVLENEKTKLKTDFKYIEEMAREKYRMAKKGEKVFKVIEKKND
jgi:cell division protein FtsB